MAHTLHSHSQYRVNPVLLDGTLREGEVMGGAKNELWGCWFFVDA